MYPVYKTLLEQAKENRSGQELDVRWVCSSQHRELLEDLYKFFKIKADYGFDINNKNLSLSELSSQVLSQASKLFEEERPDLVLVQGDTLTTQNVGLAAFNHQVLISHIEAGIRTNDISSPFPEELSRRILSQISTLNFAPTPTALNTLEAEKILFKKKSYNFHTGNTVIDALQFTCNKINAEDFDWQDFATAKYAFKNEELNLKEYLDANKHKSLVLITAHRRENTSECMENLKNALLRLLEYFKDDENLEFIVSVHKNPEARISFERLSQEAEDQGYDKIKFIEAINYPLFVYLMMSSYFIVTDSGGIQEEAPYLSKPVLVFRDLTERTEGIENNLARLIGTEENLIHGNILELLTDPKQYGEMLQEGLQPYGDGLAASRIVDVSLLYLKSDQD